MIEKLIYLDDIDPVNLYGINNIKFEIIISLFPELKIIAKGHEIKVSGKSEAIINFENKLNKLINYYNRYHNLSSEIIADIIGDKNSISKHFDDSVILYATNGKPVKARSANQQKYVDEYKKNDLLFAIGPAGTGKTYLAIALAIKALKNREVKRIILSRPAVEAGEKLGFLPGDLKEKLDPYLQALYDALRDMIASKKLENYLSKDVIQIAPLAFMRGRTLDNAIVILDEAQNTSVNQLKMFLTRMGENSKFIVTGDITQIDLPDKRQSGLLQTKNILKNIKGISFINFDTSDIVRHKLVKQIINAFDS